MLMHFFVLILFLTSSQPGEIKTTPQSGEEESFEHLDASRQTLPPRSSQYGDTQGKPSSSVTRGESPAVLPLPTDAVAIAAVEGIDSDNEFWRTTRRCGVNAAYAYLKLHGQNPKYETLLKKSEIDQLGMSIGQVAALCDFGGVASTVVRLRPAVLNAHLPAILHCEEEVGSTGHFVVLVVANETRSAMIDGTTGVFDYVDTSTLNRTWTGYAVIPTATLSFRERYPIQAIAWSLIVISAITAGVVSLVSKRPSDLDSGKSSDRPVP